MRLFTFHIEFILLGKIEIQWFSLNYEKIVGQTELFNLGIATDLEGKLNSNQSNTA